MRVFGGLCVIGTERHEARRIDDQLRGRAGRQGDPGESRFYLSLEDDLLRLFGRECTPTPDRRESAGVGGKPAWAIPQPARIIGKLT